MDKQFSILTGVVLAFVGVLALVCNLVTPLLGLKAGGWGWGAWRFWPMGVAMLGGLLVLLPLLGTRRRGLSVLFILGMPILATGGILLFTSVLGLWRAWSWLWPLEVLAVALGFLFAAIYARALWLVVPAIVIGANGLLFQFCAVTGWWEIWSVLWTIEPLSLGLALLLVGILKRSTGLILAGAIIGALGGVGLIGMTSMLSLTTLWPGLWAFNLVGPVVLIAAGLLLLILSLLRGSSAPDVAAG